MYTVKFYTATKHLSINGHVYNMEQLENKDKNRAETEIFECAKRIFK